MLSRGKVYYTTPDDVECVIQRMASGLKHHWEKDETATTISSTFFKAKILLVIYKQLTRLF